MTDSFELFRKYLSNTVSPDNDFFDLAHPYIEELSLKKGEFFLHEGRVCNKVGYVHKGLFRMFYTKDATEVNTCFCTENNMISSLSSFVNRIPSNENIQALEDAEVLTISHSNLMLLFEQNPVWQKLKSTLLEKECFRLSERLNSLSFETAMDKYLGLLNNNPEIVRRVPIQHLASYIGVSRETLSRIRARVGK